MKYKKFVLSCLLSSVLAVSVILTSSNAAYYLEIDNGQPGYDTGSTIDSVSGQPVFSPISSTSSINQDARLAATNLYGYYWWKSPDVGGAGMNVMVYLNDYRFTNRNARYELNNSGNYVSIDQYSAPAGWNAVGYSMGYRIITVKVFPNGSPGTYTGADAVVFYN